MRKLGRYALYDEIASGGMATVYLARQFGEASFARVVAVKMLHAQYAKEEAFRAMFLDEARIVSRIRHPNVIATLDVVEHEGELFIVMDYVHGESLGRLLKIAQTSRRAMPEPIALAIALDALEGLHAAHEAIGEDGAPLGIVHRDVSPQNLIVGVDGATHVADFGIAKAVGRLAEKFSVQNSVKGKAGYMSPEQIRGKVDRRSDVFAIGVVLWEMLSMQRLFTGESFIEIVAKAMDAEIPPPEGASAAVSAVVARALERDPAKRFATAREMAVALEKAGPRASAREVSEWVTSIAREAIELRAAQIAAIERGEPSEATPASAPSEIDQSVSGVSPPTAPPSASRLGWVAAAAAALVAIGTVAITSRRTVTAAPAPTVTVTVTTTVTEPVIVRPPATVSVEEAASTAPAPALSHRRKREAPPAASSGPCHYEELPDDQGILHPKKVCP